jgi:hypothetical protein
LKNRVMVTTSSAMVARSRTTTFVIFFCGSIDFLHRSLYNMVVELRTTSNGRVGLMGTITGLIVIAVMGLMGAVVGLVMRAVLGSTGAGVGSMMRAIVVWQC